jgi:Domain of unknown function (DUF4129)
MLAAAMSASGSRIAAAVIALTTLISVVAVTGGEPLARGGEPEPYIPTREDLLEAGVIDADFPVPGALPPEVFPAEAWGIGPPGPPAWLPWALVAVALLWVALGLVREVRAGRIEWRPRRAAPEEPPHEDDAVVARAAIDAALAPLRDPADPRAAVIEAYARMEQVLAGRALGRRAAEAPREYLRRVLGQRGAPERSLSALTALFEEARFSRHPIPESASRDAAAELRAVRAALAAGSGDP